MRVWFWPLKMPAAVAAGHCEFYGSLMTNLFSAILLLFMGLLILFVLGRRRFRRRGVAGLERFSSYGMAVFIRLLEALFRLLAWVAVLVGGGLLLVCWYNG